MYGRPPDATYACPSLQGFRPQTGARYIERRRLLDRLPDEPGYVVWLEAPYGYGKSVLASQWAQGLEAAGWSVVWLSGRYVDLRSTVASVLGVPGHTPWAVLLDVLLGSRALVVLEDLEGLADHEELTPLLQDRRGLVLLASRAGLAASELPRLRTMGRLVHVTAAELAFTPEEAVELVADEAVGRRLRELTDGWPLPLHFAAITGELPDRSPLLEGMRASLSDAEWEEALLLATLAQLPPDAATAATRRLAKSGFVQLGEAGYRLHPLASEHLLAEHRDEARAALEAHGRRLPPLLFGEALERCGDHEALAELFEQPGSGIHKQAPETLVRWEGLLASPATAKRHITVAGALRILGRMPEAVERLRAALATPHLTPDDEVLALMGLCWALGFSDPEAAAAVVRRGEELVGQVDAELAGRFLSDASMVDVMSGRLDDAAVKLTRALRVLPLDSPFRTGAHINLALNRWDRHGDYDGRLAAQAMTLEDVWRLYPSDAPGQCRDLAMLHLWAGDRERAREYLEQAVAGGRSNPLVRLEARAALAYLDGDVSALPGLLETAVRWQDPYTVDVVAMYAIDSLPLQGHLATARAWFDAVTQPRLAAVPFAVRLAAAGKAAEGLAALDAVLDGADERDYKLYLLAARYRVGRSAEDLESFLAQTTAGARLLPGFVPLEELPRDRPELAAAYPVAEVLPSGWREAAELRVGEAPDMELTLLGAFELRVLGRPVELTDRLKQLVTLFAIGRSRQQVAEALWPEVDAVKQRNNMGVQMSLLRAAVEPWGVPTYVVKDGLQRLSSDHDRLCRALAAGDADEVARLYREPFAGGLDVDAVADHGDHLRRRVLECLTAAAAGAEDAVAASYLSRALEVDPLNEEVLRDLLARLRAGGRTQAARRHLAEFASRLRAEMGLEPLPETLAVLEG